ncbi:MAG: transporter substrate-binding domain-containing protein [Spirochaetes bacterium]|nr:transporter substrate-binding domain-containing protein [Spirochaetota bacterium]
MGKNNFRILYRAGCVLIAAITAVFFLISCTTNSKKAAVLTADERRWLSQHSNELFFAPDPSYAPYEFYDAKEGRTKGLANEYIALIEKNIGIRFGIIRAASFSDILALAKERKVSIVNAVTETPARSEYLAFTDPYVEIPNVILVRNSVRDDLSLRDLAGKKVSVVQGYAVAEHIAATYPQVRCEPVKSDLLALLNVAYGISDVAIVDLATASYFIEKNGIVNLRVAGNVGYPVRLGIGSRKDWPELHGILQKGLAAISPDTRRAIERKWISLGSVNILQSRIFYGALVLVVLLLMVTGTILLWNRQLHRQVQLRISDYKKAMDDLKQSEDRFRKLFDGASDAVIVHDMEGRFVDVNKVACDIYGYSRDEMLHLTVFDIRPGIELAFMQNVWRRVLAEQSIFMEGMHRRRDGSEFPVEVHCSRFAEGERPLFFVSVRDITERKKGQEALRLGEERLRQSEKLNAIGQLAGGIAHDFNNQLTAILGYADLLADRLEDPRLNHYADGIRKAARRAADLTRDLLSFSRKGKYLTVSVEVHRVIGETVALLEHSIDKRIAIRQVLQAHPSCITGDPTQLQNALLNLALNARDAMPEGGVLTFSTEVTELPENAFGFTIPEGRYAAISVSDTGIGMDGETQRHLFEPFFTTKERGKGTGLGLAAVYGTVKSHQGAVVAQSEQGRGTTVTMYLPVAEHESASETAASAVHVPAKNSVNILVVDDERYVADLIADMLRALGHTVEICDDGRSAIDLYAKRWGSIDIVVLDMVMPKMGGREVFTAMRAVNPDIKALLVSGYSLEGEAQHILDLGVRGFIQKPFQKDDIARKIAEILS